MNRIPLERARKRLALIWLSGGAILFLLIAVQTLSGAYGADVEKVWSWYLQAIMPTLTLMVGAFVSNVLNSAEYVGNVDRFLYRFTFAMSLVYIIGIAAPLLFAPITSESIAVLLKSSNLYLLPLQGLVSLSLGAFFVNRSTPEKPTIASSSENS